jgi:hypothetical protein
MYLTVPECVFCEVGTEPCHASEAVCLVAGLTPQEREFDLTTVHWRFVVEQVAVGQVCLPLLLFCPVSIIALTRRTSGRRLGNFKQGL